MEAQGNPFLHSAGNGLRGRYVLQDPSGLADLPQRIELRPTDRTGSEMTLDPLLLRLEEMAPQIAGEQAPGSFRILFS